MLIVGLAPAANGGNRTGRVFTGDSLGRLALRHACTASGWPTQPTSAHAGDGQALLDARMVAAVRCAPPENKPTTAERDTCAPWLERRDRAAGRRPCGWSSRWARFGWDAALRAFAAARLAPSPGRKPRFGHGAEAALAGPAGAR